MTFLIFWLLLIREFELQLKLKTCFGKKSTKPEDSQLKLAIKIPSPKHGNFEPYFACPNLNPVSYTIQANDDALEEGTPSNILL